MVRVLPALQYQAKPMKQAYASYTTKLFCLIAFAGVLATGCKKDSKNVPVTTPKPVTGPYLYVAGSANGKATYWKTSLSQSTVSIIADTISNSAYITSLITSGTDVYIAAQSAGYWKNKTFVPVTNANSIEYLTLSGSAVVVTGFDKSGDIAYWPNNSEIDLENTIGRNLFPYQSVLTDALTGIALSGSDVYVSGKLSTENEPYSPPNAVNGDFGLVWTNANVRLLSRGGNVVSAYYNSTVGITLVGSDIYVAGRDSSYAGGYWKNNVWTPINNGAYVPTSISSQGTDVYITGFDYTPTGPIVGLQGNYWKNGTEVKVAGANSTNAIVINGSDVYVLGVDYNNNNVVWKNGAVFETIGSANIQTATSLAIGN